MEKWNRGRDQGVMAVLDEVGVRDTDLRPKQGRKQAHGHHRKSCPAADAKALRQPKARFVSGTQQGPTGRRGARGGWRGWR